MGKECDVRLSQSEDVEICNPQSSLLRLCLVQSFIDLHAETGLLKQINKI